MSERNRRHTPGVEDAGEVVARACEIKLKQELDERIQSVLGILGQVQLGK
jgi:hypothetical protein